MERRLRRGVVLGSGICLVVSVAALLLHQSSRAPHAVEMVDLMPDVAPRDSQSLRPDSIEVESADGLGLDGGKQAANAELKFAASLRKAEDASWAREKADQLVRSLSKIASTTSSQAVEKMPMTSNKVVEAEPVDAVHSPESDDAGAGSTVEGKYDARDKQIDWDASKTNRAADAGNEQTAAAAAEPSHEANAVPAQAAAAHDDGLAFPASGSKAAVKGDHSVGFPKPGSAQADAARPESAFPQPKGEIWSDGAAFTEPKSRAESKPAGTDAVVQRESSEAVEKSEDRDSVRGEGDAAFDWKRTGGESDARSGEMRPANAEEKQEEELRFPEPGRKASGDQQQRASVGGGDELRFPEPGTKVLANVASGKASSSSRDEKEGEDERENEQGAGMEDGGFRARDGTFAWAHKAAADAQQKEDAKTDEKAEQEEHPQPGMQFNARDKSFAWRSAGEAGKQREEAAEGGGEEEGGGAEEGGVEGVRSSKAERAAEAEEDGGKTGGDEDREKEGGEDEEKEGGEKEESGKVGAKVNPLDDGLDWPDAKGGAEEKSEGAGGKQAAEQPKDGEEKEGEEGAAHKEEGEAQDGTAAAEDDDGKEEDGENAKGGSDSGPKPTVGGGYGLDWPKADPATAKSKASSEDTKATGHEPAGGDGGSRGSETDDPLQTDAWGDRGPVGPNSAGKTSDRSDEIEWQIGRAHV